MPGGRLLDPQSRIDGEVQHVDHEVDDDENQRDQAEVGGHHRDVGELNGLDEQQAHAGPLEHRLGDDCKGNQRPQLQAGDRDHGHQRVLQRMTEVDRAVGQAAGAGTFAAFYVDGAISS